MVTELTWSGVSGRIAVPPLTWPLICTTGPVLLPYSVPEQLNEYWPDPTLTGMDRVVPGPTALTWAYTAPSDGLTSCTSTASGAELWIWSVCAPAVGCRQPVPHADADTLIAAASELP